MKTAPLPSFDFADSPTAPVREWLRILHRANPVLSWTGWLNVGLAAGALVLLSLDHRLVTGALVWIKPLKFSLSIVAFTWTLGWLLADLPATAQPSVRRLSWGIAVSMAVEQVVIFVQAARGTTSHYNISSGLNGMLFSLMSIFIMLNTAMTVWAQYLA